MLLKLCLFNRLVSRNNITLLAILSAAYAKKDSWLKGVHEDLNKLAEVEDKLAEFRGAPIELWANLIKERGTSFLKVIKLAISREDVNTVKFWWPKGSNGGRDDNAASDPAPVIHFTCAECGYECSTPQAYNWHMYDRHGRRAHLRQYVHTNVCE